MLEIVEDIRVIHIANFSKFDHSSRQIIQEYDDFVDMIKDQLKLLNSFLLTDSQSELLLKYLHHLIES